MNKESIQLQAMRQERLLDLQNKHQQQLSEFDGLSRRYIDNSFRSSNLPNSGSPSLNRGISQNSPHFSRGTFGLPLNRFPNSNRESSISMNSLQQTNFFYNSQHDDNIFTNSRPRPNENRNGSAVDRRSYIESGRR